MSDVARLCLLTAMGCFAVALLGAVVNLFIDNWFQSVGMAMVGLFYLVLFLANLPPRGIAAIGAADVLKPDYVEYRVRQRTTEHVEEPEEQCV
jgi:hypothetical protein